jgi:magnesium transporter
MICTNKYRNLTWIDVESPTQNEITHLIEEYDIPEIAAKELLSKTVRSKVDLHHNTIYLILHFPKVHTKGDVSTEQEIDFLLGKDYVITVHYEKIRALSHCTHSFESHTVSNKNAIGDHAGFLFFYLIKELYKDSMEALEGVNDNLKDIEKSIFEGKEGDMVHAISQTNRKLLDFKQAIRFHGDVLESFENAGKNFYGDNFSYYLSAITGEYNKVNNLLEGHKEILRDLRETNDTLLSWKTNQTVKSLTVLSFIMLPLALITGIFGMNSEVIFINSSVDFYSVLIAMVCLAIMMFLFFKGKKWI